MIKTIPLNKLVASPRNVRRSVDSEADLQLQADIEARGLLQNLVVSAARKPRGCFAVEGGERRRRALQALADAGKLEADHPVCCLVVGAADAGEASLAENFQRLAMNPADECLAFRQLIDQGADSETIARRFGLTVRFVEGRLRLADLAPVVFEALGAGTISLDVAKAYAATADRDRQAYVFEQVERSFGSAHPDSIRRMMTQATVSASDRRARFVGEEAYVAAGGRIERDLFSDEGDARWLDIALVETLALQKLEAIAAETAAEQGLAFVRPVLEGWVSYGATEGLRRVSLETPPLSEAESAEVDELEEEIGRLVELLEDEDTDDEARASAEARIRELDQAIDAIVNKEPVIDEALKATLGAFLLLDEQGCPRLDATFYTAVEPDGGESRQPSDGPNGAKEEPAAKRAASLPRRLVDELAMQRRDILAAHVAANPAFALDLATFLMVDSERDYSGGGSGSSLAARPAGNPVFDFETPGARATIALAETAGALDRSWVDAETRADRFEAFRALPDEARSAWLAHAVARTLAASVHLPGERACVFHDRLGALLGIEVAAWWRPTGSNYFDRVPKSMALAAIAEVGGPPLAERYAKSKKAELSQACERIFAGEVVMEAEVRQGALAWVPEAMKFGETGPDADDEPAAEAETVEEPEDATPVMDPIDEAA